MQMQQEITRARVRKGTEKKTTDASVSKVYV